VQDLIHMVMIFFAFSMPLFAWLLVLSLGLAIAVLAVKVVRNRGTHSRRWLLASSFTLMLLMGDEVLGWLHFHYLCAAQEGYTVYRQVNLPAEYWRDDGSPAFFSNHGWKITPPLNEEYATSMDTVASPPAVVQIDRRQLRVTALSNGESLGTYTWFENWGGWLKRYLGSTRKFEVCPSQTISLETLLRKVFIQPKN